MKTPDTIREMFNGYRVSRILLSAFELDFFTLLGSNGMTAAQLSNRCGTSERSTEMMLNALCALELLKKREGIFYNTAESLRYLDRNSGDYLSGLHHSISLWRVWSTLTEAVKKGHSVAWADEEKLGTEWLVPFIEAMHDRYAGEHRRRLYLHGKGSDRMDAGCGIDRDNADRYGQPDGPDGG